MIMIAAKLTASALTFLCQILLFKHALGFSGGAPTETCTSMRPNPMRHQAEPQTTMVPITIKVSDTYYNKSSKIGVYVKGVNKTMFRGILIQARAMGSTAAQGYFSIIPTNTKYLDCTSDLYNADNMVSAVGF